MSFTSLLPLQPQEPLPGDCCGHGCNPCVLDVYQDLLKKWKNECTNLQSSSNAANNGVPVLSMTRYMPFQLISKQKLTKDTNIYTFQAMVVTGNVKSPTDGGKIPCLAGQHLMLRNCYEGEVKGRNKDKKDEVITRAYTVISTQENHHQGQFDVMIKLYEKGKMSSFIRDLEIGNVTYWRGPYTSFEYQRNSFPSILMLCAGTGVAPMYSIARMIVNDDQDDTIIKMMFSCRNLESILLRNEIRALSSFWNFSADIFLSNENSGLPLYRETFKFGRIAKDEVECQVNKLGKKCFVLICGPVSFNESMTEILQGCSLLRERIFVF